MANAITQAAGQPPAQQESKLLGIELLRFLSSLAVLIFHYAHFKFVGGAPADFVASQQPYYSVLGFFYQYGFYGVEIFWCISGFIFFWKYAAEIARGRVDGYVFVILRFTRLYPLHFATLLFMACMQYLYFSSHGFYFVYQFNDAYHFMLQLGLASNWGLQRGDSFNGPIWSISIEVLVYAFFFISLKYLSARAPFILLVALAAAAMQIFTVHLNAVFACLMFFYLGCLTAIVYRRSTGDEPMRKRATAGAVILLAGILTLDCFIDVKAKYFLVLFTPPVIFLCVTYVRESRIANALLVPAGNMTYASYLIHVPIQIAVVTYCNHAGITLPFYSRAFFLAFIAVTLALSYVTFEYFEMPAQRLLRRALLFRRRPAPRPA